MALNTITNYVYYYQPKLDLHTGDVDSYECLIRGVTKSGIVSPEFFLKSLKGKWGQLWPYLLGQLVPYTSEEEQKFAINVAPTDILKGKFLYHLEKFLAESKLNSSQLELELTEQEAIFEFRDLNRKIEYFRELGIDVWLDDFGSGYCNFSYLKELEVKGIKLDRTILNGIADSDIMKSIVESVVNIGRQKKCKVLAEGIETSADLKVASDLGCDYAQGYYIGRPLPYPIFKRPHAESCPLTDSPAGTKAVVTWYDQGGL